MKKLILLLVALPLFLANCAKESQPEGPTSVSTTYKGTYTLPSVSTEGSEVDALVVITENSSTNLSLSVQVTGQPERVLTATKDGTEINIPKQEYQGSNFIGHAKLDNNGELLRLNIEETVSSTTIGNATGSFVGYKI